MQKITSERKYMNPFKTHRSIDSVRQALKHFPGPKNDSLDNVELVLFQFAGEQMPLN